MANLSCKIRKHYTKVAFIYASVLIIVLLRRFPSVTKFDKENGKIRINCLICIMINSTMLNCRLRKEDVTHLAVVHQLPTFCLQRNLRWKLTTLLQTATSNHHQTLFYMRDISSNLKENSEVTVLFLGQ